MKLSAMLCSVFMLGCTLAIPLFASTPSTGLVPGPKALDFSQTKPTPSPEPTAPKPYSLNKPTPQPPSGPTPTFPVIKPAGQVDQPRVITPTPPPPVNRPTQVTPVSPQSLAPTPRALDFSQPKPAIKNH